MQHHQLEHLVRAAAAMTNTNALLIVGTQSLLISCPAAPEILMGHAQADFITPDNQTLALIIEHDIGPASRFNLQFNYCARGLGFVNVVLPEGWEARQIAFPVQGAPDLQVHCLSALDTAASKLAAGRVKDYRFVSAMIHYGLINAIDLHAHVPLLPVPQEQKDTLLAWAHEQCGQAGVVS